MSPYEIYTERVKNHSSFINWSYVGELALIQFKKFAFNGTAFGVKVWNFLDVGKN